MIYNNDGNSAALYAHHERFGAESGLRSSVAAIVGTGLGGGIVVGGQVVKGAAGMAGELGHVPIPLDGLLAEGQPMPACNCGQSGDAESVASLTGIQNNLLPYWLTRYEGHELAGVPIGQAAKLIRKYAENGDEMAAAAWSRPRRTSASGSSPRCAPARCSVRSRPGPPRSSWSPTLTWPAPAARPLPRVTGSSAETRCCPAAPYPRGTRLGLSPGFPPDP